MKKSLGTDGQIDKLSQAMKMANDASTSNNPEGRVPRACPWVNVAGAI